MREDRDVDVVGPDGIRPGRLVIALEPPWRLRLEVGGEAYAADGRDLFQCLTAVRRAVERHGLRICCLGSRPDVFPSGMSIQMSGGRKAYRHHRGRRPTRADLVDVFDPASCADVAPSTSRNGQCGVFVGRRRPKPVPSPELVEEARKHPAGWVYEIDGSFGPDEAVPPEAIRGAWTVGEDGTLTGEYEGNPNYRPRR